MPAPPVITYSFSTAAEDAADSAGARLPDNGGHHGKCARRAADSETLARGYKKFLIRSTLLLTAAIISSCGDRQEAFYSTAVEARTANAVDRGWIPGWLPKSAHAIHEVHNIDTTQSMLAFSFDAADVPNLSTSCKQVQSEALRPVPFKVAWWPKDVPPSGLVTHRRTYYHCDDGEYVAVAADDGQLFHWRP